MSQPATISRRPDDFTVTCDPQTGAVASAKLYGRELLDTDQPAGAEILVNGLPLTTRLHPHAKHDPAKLHLDARFKGERFTDYISGYALVLKRVMGHRTYAKHPTFGVDYYVRREHAELTQPVPGPGGTPQEAPCWVDSLTIMNWKWRFWGDDTRMVFVSVHSGGPDGDFGHVGYDDDTPEFVKNTMKNPLRRTYPSCMGLHGGLWYDAVSGNWLAITARRPNMGYMLNLDSAGRGLSFDMLMHAQFPLEHAQTLPEIKINWGADRDSMMQWLADYSTFYYEQPPDWVFRTLFRHGLAWDNAPTWTEQADRWTAELAGDQGSGISYSLVTNRPVKSGTLPIGYEPDPNHGTQAEFKAMCLRMKEQGVPVIVWMSHSGLNPHGPDVDDDWFVRGVDGRTVASWGDEDGGMMFVNMGHPGYIAYTEKWIEFYIRECGASGIFMDCLGFATPNDYRPRPWMRYPTDAPRLAIPFIERVFKAIKAANPEAILLGEGCTLDAPVEVFSIHTNTVRAASGLGPRDFYLAELNKWSTKRLVVDQGRNFAPASGFCKIDTRPEATARNAALTALLRDHGGPRAFTALPGDLSIHDALRLLVVPQPKSGKPDPTVCLPAPWDSVVRLKDQLTGAVHERDASGAFGALPTGIYAMEVPS